MTTITITLPRAVVEQALEALTAHADLLGTMYLRMDAITALRAALAQEQAEPVEPVAWMYTGIKQDGTEHGPHLVWKPEYMDAMSASKGAKATPLYTSPPQRKPLTEEMEARCPYAEANPTLRGAFFDGWLNSERAHGIKE